ncbi:MAG: hypothetical protein QOF34_973, partial [Sphingomonadales bacterium]|nr:hypothetical protein [Sphingomonadales bacterium]
DFAILASPAARGRSIELNLSGFAQPAGCGSLDLSIGGARMTVRPTGDNFSTRVSATLNCDADTTPVIVTLNLPPPADGSAASLALESIDISLPDRQRDAA